MPALVAAGSIGLRAKGPPGHHATPSMPGLFVGFVKDMIVAPGGA